MPLGGKDVKDLTESTGLITTTTKDGTTFRYNGNDTDTLYYNHPSNSVSIEGQKIGKSFGEENTNYADQGPEQNPSGTPSNLIILLWKIPRRKKVVVLFCTLAAFLSYCVFSLIAPFFPLVAQKKGMDLTSIGFVFSVYQLLGFVASPVIGNFLFKIGPKFVYLSGLFVCGIAAICFGLLDKGPDGLIFSVMCILCRSFEALGMSAFTTAGVAIVTSEFPDHVGTVTSILNFGSALGLMTGPVVGGVLYELGGFGLPFFVTAALSLLDALAVYFFLPELCATEQGRASDRSMLKLLRSFSIVGPMLCIVVGFGGIAIYDAVFSIRLKSFSLSPTAVGAFYLVASGGYTIACPIWGYGVDSTGLKEPMVMCAMFAFGLGFLICGPSPFLPFVPSELWSVALGFVLIGGSLGGITVPSLACMMRTAHDQGYGKNVDTHGLVSGLYFCASSLGGFLGPLAGSAIVDRYGFPNAFTSFGLCSFSVMLLYAGFYFLKRKHNRTNT